MLLKMASIKIDYIPVKKKKPYKEIVLEAE